MTTVSGADALNAILICGLMGVVGQGARAAVGLRSNNSLSSTTPSAQSGFSAAYFALSVMIGFIAGVLAGFVTGLSNFVNLDLSNTKLLLAIAASGYAGADFIENSLSIFIPSSNQGVVPKQASAPQAALPIQAAFATTQSVLGPPTQPGFPIPASSLTAALGIASPSINTAIWTPALIDAFTKFDLNTSHRVAAALGQFLVEAGSTFRSLTENLDYTNAARLVQVFPHEFPDTATAQSYVGQPQRIANRVYAGRLGNGPEESGDGFLFRGRGLIQLTGRDEYTQFGATVGKDAIDAAAYCETTEGAAMSGCWYLSTRGCLPFADTWNIQEITRRVNGPAMLGENQREAYSNTILKHLG